MIKKSDYKFREISNIRLTSLLATLIILLSSCLSTGNDLGEVEGRVTSETGGLPNVVVTDGYQSVVTGEDGSYTLTPHPGAKFVYISTPAGYLPAEEMQVPRFYIPLEKGKKKQYDFSLKR